LKPGRNFDSANDVTRDSKFHRKATTSDRFLKLGSIHPHFVLRFVLRPLRWHVASALTCGAE
jgi:hypothetical protein